MDGCVFRGMSMPRPVAFAVFISGCRRGRLGLSPDMAAPGWLINIRSQESNGLLFIWRAFDGHSFACEQRLTCAAWLSAAEERGKRPKPSLFSALSRLN